MKGFIRRGVLALCALAALGGCASTAVRDRQLARLEQLQAVAGEPVRSFRFWQLQRWEGVDDRHVVVWTRLDTAYLLSLRPPCWGLQSTPVIGLSSTLHRVDAKFDKVLFERETCWIDEIRPLDVKALRAQRAKS